MFQLGLLRGELKQSHQLSLSWLFIGTGFIGNGKNASICHSHLLLN